MEGFKGYVYILTNPSFREDWIKIGKSSRPVDVRSKELDNTAVPLPFNIYATMRTSKYNEVEKIIHKTIDRLTNLRIRSNREFFNVKPEQALEVLKDIASAISDAEIFLYEEEKPIRIFPKNALGKGQAVVKNNRNKKQMYDKSVFSWDDKTFFSKRRFVFEIVSRFLKENPNYKYKELLKLFPANAASNKTFVLSSEYASKSEDAKKRYSANCLTTIDKKTFFVSTQWGKPQFESKIYPLLGKLGFSFIKKNRDELNINQVLY